MKQLVNIEEIINSYKRISKYTFNTPLLSSGLLNKKYNTNIYVKAENLQKMGSFKFRGAMNAILQLENNQNTVLAWSSGNHAQAIASAAYLNNKKAIIVMPDDSPKTKLNGTKAWGAKIVTYDRHRESREELGKKIAKKEKAIIIPPFDDPTIINGQGTAGYEMSLQCNVQKIKPDIALCCCGGGGLISGVSTALLSKFPNLPIYAVEPKDFNDTKLSLEKDKIIEIDITKKSICDALLAAKPGELTFSINKNNLMGGLLVSDEEAMFAMKIAFQYLKIVLEPGGAVALAAAIFNKVDIENKNVLVVASGGNVDKELFQKCLSL